ncbi:hypothetical protein QR680_004332 [Steinernema hermaphroditum]|uniref:Uncharacterized protein n=1 Tax=Steinernema hermaphroditum TaxID=289476 RepID=A0AA39HNE4_9BILA|nr:hypothetical protein QR680_004332 [Steinernema hermaphroditum]
MDNVPYAFCTAVAELLPSTKSRLNYQLLHKFTEVADSRECIIWKSAIEIALKKRRLWRCRYVSFPAFRTAPESVSTDLQLFLEQIRPPMRPSIYYVSLEGEVTSKAVWQSPFTEVS